MLSEIMLYLLSNTTEEFSDFVLQENLGIITYLTFPLYSNFRSGKTDLQYLPTGFPELYKTSRETYKSLPKKDPVAISPAWVW